MKIRMPLSLEEIAFGTEKTLKVKSKQSVIHVKELGPPLIQTMKLVELVMEWEKSDK